MTAGDLRPLDPPHHFAVFGPVFLGLAVFVGAIVLWLVCLVRRQRNGGNVLPVSVVSSASAAARSASAAARRVVRGKGKRARALS